MKLLLTQLLSFAVIACSAHCAFAQGSKQFTNQIIDGRKVTKPWAELVGREVVVEGLAWGATEKGMGQRVVLDEAVVYARNIDYLKHKAHGRLVRVSGTLRRGQVTKASPGAGGFGAEFDYFYIDVTRWEIIEEVSKPWMEEIMPTKKR